MRPFIKTTPEHSSMEWRPTSRIRKTISIVLLVLLLVLLSCAGAAYLAVYSRVDAVGVSLPGKDDVIPADLESGRALSILIIGQDTRDGEDNIRIGGVQEDEHQADTLMIAHIPADRSRIDVVSIPRDSMVDRPSCETSRGVMRGSDGVMVNSVFNDGWSYGGDISSAVSCTVATVSNMTGLSLKDFIVVDFAGMVKMVDALGGVELCVPSAVDDDTTGLHLEPGVRRMDGTQATQYARVRHGVSGADGSDIMRTIRQQWLVKAIIKSVLDGGVLSDPSRLYPVGMAALDSLKMSGDLADVHTLVGLAYSMRNLRMDSIHMQTAPTRPYPEDANRVILADTDIWSKMMEDRPISMTRSSSGGDAASSSSPGLGGGQRTDGVMIDPDTGGIVDPNTGYITDKKTGSFIGVSSRVLDSGVCKSNGRQ